VEGVLPALFDYNSLRGAKYGPVEAAENGLSWEVAILSKELWLPGYTGIANSVFHYEFVEIIRVGFWIPCAQSLCASQKRVAFKFRYHYIMPMFEVIPRAKKNFEVGFVSK
jgi:hypothetical protein